MNKEFYEYLVLKDRVIIRRCDTEDAAIELAKSLAKKKPCHEYMAIKIDLQEYVKAVM